MRTNNVILMSDKFNTCSIHILVVQHVTMKFV